ncbi:TPA: recombinase family protein [Vibrio parahaemolyticus]|nr:MULTISPECIES: recombinase family protein [Vibrio]EGQ7795474.1 recombinase family protein [Vibrio parahaemolyticus]EJA7341897.1 recombinase family protein [Vibrio parahaemolyticus]EJB8408844.1 recombinase family protein [Vibrio parahaemolyticus]MBE3884182.1 recombinase family protein [Vibrio parahaemolyticus]MBE4177688.1 recombinase family protein [Vibrio parahaemolyticus]
MSIAYSYIRFSSAQQAQGDSLRRQTQLAQRYCEDNNLTLSDTNFQDLGVSAFHSANAQEDGGLGQFLTALSEGLIPEGSYLLVESLDRLSRAKVQTALEQMLGILRRGVKIVTLMDHCIYDGDSDSRDLIISLTIMERAHNESKTKSERLKAAWDNKRQNPNSTNRHGSTPFWLTLNSDKRTYTVKEEYAELIRKIYQLSIDGWGLVKIVRYLNECGIPAPKGRSWAITTVSKLLNSKAALGHYEPSQGRKSLNTVIEDYYPSIIDEKTYYTSLQRKKERSAPESAGRKTTYPNPLVHIAKCRLCGSSMFFENKQPSLNYLTCREFKKKNCTNKPIRMELIYRFIYEVFNSPMYHQQHAKLVDKSKQKDINYHAELKGRYEAERKAYEELLEASSSFSDPFILKELQKRSTLILELSKQLEEAKAKETVEKARTVHINFTEALQLTVNAFHLPLEEVKVEELSTDELFNTRVRLNRILKQAFNHLSIFHCNESKRITIETEVTEDYPIDLRYETNQKAIKEPMKNRIWSVY